MPNSPRLVLLGGGHAMLPSLARAREWTEAGVDVTLIDPQRWLYYSGMVPEYLGGVYAVDDIRVDLRRLAREGGVRHVEAAATAIDPDNRVVSTADGGTHPFDVLGVDVGGVNPAVPDAAVGTKPIWRIRALAPRLDRVLDAPGAMLGLTVVGGGAAGTEVALNVTGRFAGAGREADLHLTLIEQDDQILPGFPDGMRSYAARLLRERGATLRTGTTVESVGATEGGAARVETSAEGGETATLRPDAVLWATGSVGPALLRDSGLSTDERGFLHVDRTLRTPTHPYIFAAGDCATIPGLNLDKVGVHAVKQGPDLRKNLDRTVRQLSRDGTPPSASDLATFRPYPVAPLLLSTGVRRAIWTAGPFWAAHPWLLRLKHWIDRRWIRTYAPDRWGRAGWRTLLGAEAASAA
jgi:selenide,water dikinase